MNLYIVQSTGNGDYLHLCTKCLTVFEAQNIRKKLYQGECQRCHKKFASFYLYTREVLKHE